MEFWDLHQLTSYLLKTGYPIRLECGGCWYSMDFHRIEGRDLFITHVFGIFDLEKTIANDAKQLRLGQNTASTMGELQDAGPGGIKKLIQGWD
jgi:hypothetical protein